MFEYYLSHRLVRVCEIKLSHMGKNNGNPDLVSEKKSLLLLDVNSEYLNRVDSKRSHQITIYTVLHYVSDSFVMIYKWNLSN